MRVTIPNRLFFFSPALDLKGHCKVPVTAKKAASVTFDDESHDTGSGIYSCY